MGDFRARAPERVSFVVGLQAYDTFVLGFSPQAYDTVGLGSQERETLGSDLERVRILGPGTSPSDFWTGQWACVWGSGPERVRHFVLGPGRVAVWNCSSAAGV